MNTDLKRLDECCKQLRQIHYAVWSNLLICITGLLYAYHKPSDTLIGFMLPLLLNNLSLVLQGTLKDVISCLKEQMTLYKINQRLAELKGSSGQHPKDNTRATKQLHSV